MVNYGFIKNQQMVAERGWRREKRRKDIEIHRNIQGYIEKCVQRCEVRKSTWREN